MSAYEFSRAVVIWTDVEHPEFGLARIETVIQAYDALHSTRLLDVSRTAAPELWDATEQAIDIALINPSPATIKAAEDALTDLVKRTAPIPASIRRRLAPDTCASGPLSFRAIMQAVWPEHLIRELNRI